MKTHLPRALPRLLAAIISTAILLPGCALLLSTQMAAQSGITAGKSAKNDVSPPLRSQPPIMPRVFSTHVKRGPRPTLPTPPASPDPVVQSTLLATPKMPATGANWEGINFAGSGNTPPDTNGAAGPNHYIQIVNMQLQVWDKKGASLLGPIPIASLWSGFGGACELYGSGDPVVLYDRLADRWFVSQIGGAPVLAQPFHECIAISATPDPLGAWNRYAFQMPGDDFIDYPKFGVWPDGYYMTENEYNNTVTSFLGSRAWAFDRAAMIAGQPASFQMSPLILGLFGGTMMPADCDGRTPPPAGAPNYILSFSSPFYLWQFHIDWQNPLNSTFTNASLLTAGFTASPTCLNPGCVPEKSPSSANVLSVLGDRFMFRLAYRNFVDHESLVISHVVRSNTNLGMRWYEIRSPGAAPFVFQQSTFAPDLNHRWMGSIAMDGNGNIALGYSISNDTLYPSIRYAGRLASDPLGELTQGEASIFEGVGYQDTTSGNSGRWGDYSSMSIDPADDCTFWYTTEYNSSNKGGNWATRIASFRFPGCGDPDLPPVISITSPANGDLLEGTSTIKGTAADDSAVSKVEVAIDSGPFQPAAGTTSWSFPLDMTTLKPGYHTVNARATDDKGQIGTTVIAVFPNPLPQGAITFPAPNASIFGSITVAGTAAATNTTVAKVEVSACGQPFSLASGTTSWTFVWDTTLCADGAVAIVARVTDGSGGSSTVSESVSIGNHVPPTVAITSPAPGAFAIATITVAGSASSNHTTISQVEVSACGQPFNLASGTTSWTFVWDTTRCPDGAAVITARATDSTAGSSSVSESVVIANKDAPPTVVITFPKKNSSFQTNFGVLGTAADIDGSVIKVEISIDNGPWQLCQNTTSWACSVSVAGLIKGKHQLTTRATDNVGKVGFDSLIFMIK
jgi:Bacterial Ig domain